MPRGGAGRRDRLERLVAHADPAGSTGGYFELRNGGTAAVQLVVATSPDCGSPALHESADRGGTGAMRELGSVAVLAGGSLPFAPGGDHLMCMRPSPGMKPGGTVPVTLRFGDGSTLDIRFAARGARGPWSSLAGASRRRRHPAAAGLPSRWRPRLPVHPVLLLLLPERSPMPTSPKPIPAVIRSGTVAAATSALALAVAGIAERRGAFRPINATSHWRHGATAAARTELDLAHTGVGAATHLAATLFWAVLFESLVRFGGRAGRRRVPAAAAVTAALAAIVDYRLTPRRFTPGWEHALTRRSMAAVYATMAAGLALGRRSAR